MITLSNGHTFEYMVASGALAFDGQGWPWEKPLVWLKIIKPELFTVVIKSLTREPRSGNLRWWKPWHCTKLIPGGSVNKVGLTNPGIEWWCQKIGPNINYQKYPIISSIFGNKKELTEMTTMLNPFNLVGLEINVSCPNTGHPIEQTQEIVDTVKTLQQISRHPLILKISVAQDYLSIADKLKNTIEAIDLNSVPWELIFPNKQTPLWKLDKRVGGGGGGVSGKPAQKLNWKAVRELAMQGNIPVIGPSIMEFSDMHKIRELGASAVSFGAIHLRAPWKPTYFVEKETKK